MNKHSHLLLEPSVPRLLPSMDSRSWGHSPFSIRMLRRSCQVGSKDLFPSARIKRLPRLQYVWQSTLRKQNKAVACPGWFLLSSSETSAKDTAVPAGGVAPMQPQQPSSRQHIAHGGLQPTSDGHRQQVYQQSLRVLCATISLTLSRHVICQYHVADDLESPSAIMAMGA